MRATLNPTNGWLYTFVILMALAASPGLASAAQATADPNMANWQALFDPIGLGRAAFVAAVALTALGLLSFAALAVAGGAVAAMAKYLPAYFDFSMQIAWPYAATATCAIAVLCCLPVLFGILRSLVMLLALLVVVAAPAFWISSAWLQTPTWLAAGDALVAMTLIPALLVRLIGFLKDGLIAAVRSNPKLIVSALNLDPQILVSALSNNSAGLMELLHSEAEPLIAAIADDASLYEAVIEKKRQLDYLAIQRMTRSSAPEVRVASSSAIGR